MPREGGDALLRFVRDVVEGKGYTFGDPWLPEGGSTLVLPVLRRDSEPRRYRLAEEVAADVSAEDPGRLDRLRVRNGSDVTVFVRPGLLFRGRDTPSRGTTTGILVKPGASADVEVKCVHPSQPVTRGTALEVADVPLPEAVLGALLAIDQGLVWETVRSAVPDGRGGNVGRASSDDLVDAPVRPADADPPVRDLPSSPSQCGAILLDAAGIVTAEILDHPDSWRHAARGFYARHGARLHPEHGSVLRPSVDPELCLQTAREFFVGLGKTSAGTAGSRRWRVSGCIATCTSLDGSVIHLVAEPAPLAGGHLPADAGTEAGARLREPALPHGTAAAPASDDGEAVAISLAADLAGDEEPAPPSPRPRPRKILTTGWDPATLQALDACSAKEFQGDRSATVRFLVQRGLGRRGYLGPQAPARPTSPSTPTWEPDLEGPTPEAERRILEARVMDLERIASTDEYAGWLRKRARLELERTAESAGGEAAAAARAALDRIPPERPVPEPPIPEEMEAPPEEPPVDVSGILRRALTASLHGSFAEALALFDEVLEVEPENVTALLGRAVAFKRAGKAQEALAGLDLVLALEPGNAAALLNRGRILRDSRDMAGALETFDRLVEVARNDWDVWMERGDVLARMGRHGEALASYKEALRRNPDDEKLQGKVRALERSRTAAARGTSTRVAPGGVEEGQSYLVKAPTTEAGYRVFRGLVARGVPGLLVTCHPGPAHAGPDLAGIRVLRLGHGQGLGLQDSRDLASLTAVLDRFIREHEGRGAILLDGLDALLAENGSRETILFVERVNEFVLQRRAIFLVLAAPDAIPERDMALLERSLGALSAGSGDLDTKLG